MSQIWKFGQLCICMAWKSISIYLIFISIWCFHLDDDDGDDDDGGDDDDDLG